MKRLFTILLLLTATLTVAAQQMRIDKGYNNEQVIALADFKQITFDGATVNIELTDGTIESSTMEEIHGIYFGDFTSIEEGVAASEEFISYLSTDCISVNCSAGTVVTIYNLTGSQLLQTRQQSDAGSISIANLPRGIYIVKTNERSAKIIRR